MTSLLARALEPLSPSAVLWPLMIRVGSGRKREKVQRSGAREGGGVHVASGAGEQVRNRATPGVSAT